MTDLRNDSDPERDPFDALLQGDWISEAAVREPSAVERDAAAKTQARAFKRDGRRARRRSRLRKMRANARPYLIPIVFLALVGGVLYWQFRPTHTTIRSTIPGVSAICTIRVIQAIPSDQHAAPGDTERIRTIATAMRDWFGRETAGKVPRIARDSTVIRVQTVNLGVAGSELKTSINVANDVLLEILKANVQLRPDEAFLVFVAIRPDGLCGESFARTAVVFLKSCDPKENDFQTNPANVAAHELLHVLGAVEDCAPHYRSGSHVSGPADDIMYEPRANEARRAAVQHLDPGHDDYYGHHRKNCLDVASLPVWVPTG